jgi:hypothetical protein
LKLHRLSSASGRNVTTTAICNSPTVSGCHRRAHARELQGRPDRHTLNHMMIQLQLLDGKPVAVNTDQVSYFQPSNDQTLLFFGSGAMIYIKEPYDVVSEMFDQTRHVLKPLFDFL